MSSSSREYWSPRRLPRSDSPRSIAACVRSRSDGRSSADITTIWEPNRSPSCSGGNQGSEACLTHGSALSSQTPMPLTRSLSPSSLNTRSSSISVSSSVSSAPRRCPETLRRKSRRSAAVPPCARLTAHKARSTSGVKTTNVLLPTTYRCFTLDNLRNRRANSICGVTGRVLAKIRSSISGLCFVCLVSAQNGIEIWLSLSVNKRASSKLDATTIFSDRRWSSLTMASSGRISAMRPQRSIRDSRSSFAVRLNSSMASVTV